MKDWSKFEKSLLVISIFLVLVFGIVFKNNLITIGASMIGIICALFLAKGKAIGQFLGIPLVILYSITSYRNKFYGEIIIYIGLMLPMYIYGIIEWLRHNSKKTDSVEINEIKSKEWLILSFVGVTMFVGFYFLLKTLNTSNLVVSTLSLVDNVFAVYLLVRRSKYGFVAYIVNDIILISLWAYPLFLGKFLYISMLLNPIINLINDSYGVYNWSKLQKKQN